MKNKLLVLLLITSYQFFGQQPFNDALVLEKYWNDNLRAFDISPENSGVILPILYKYIDDSTKNEITVYQNKINKVESQINILTAQQVSSNSANARIIATQIVDLNEMREDLITDQFNLLKSSFNNSNNPFITLPSSVQSSDIGNFNTSSYESVGFVKSIGGLNVSTIADGLAKFLVERTKQELSISFFQKFKDKLNDSENNDLAKLFPQTFEVLNAIDTEIYQYSHYLNTLREAFKKDLSNVLIELEPFLTAKKKKLYLADENDATAMKIEYFESMLLLINNLRQGVHPAEAIGKLEFQLYHSNNTALNNIKESVKLFNIFSNSLRSSTFNRYWVSSSELQALMDTSTFKIYLGLLYQLHGDQDIFGNQFGYYLKRVEADLNLIEDYKIYVQRLIIEGDKISVAIQNIEDKKLKGEKVDSYKALFQTTLGFLNNFDEINKLNLGVNLDNSENVWDILALLNELYLDINEGNYNALIIDLSNLLNEILDPNDFKWKGDLMKYGTFIANVAQAENSDEVKAAIEAVALPAGSAIIKRRSEFNVALNAYVGLSPALEYNGDTDDTKFSLGINAPVGIATSWDLKGKDKEYGSISLFVPIIDIGAVTNFRFEDDMTEELPEIKLQNIFAPGLYVVHGLPNSPISWGLGAQFGPQLREVSAEVNTFTSEPSYSFRAFIAVDIPLINLYTRSR